MIAAMAAPPTASRRPHGRTSTYTADDRSRPAGGRPTTRSVHSDVAEHLEHAGQHPEAAGPVEVEEVPVRDGAVEHRSGKTSMKPSSIGGPGARISPRSGRRTTTATMPIGSHRRSGDDRVVVAV